MALDLAVKLALDNAAFVAGARSASTAVEDIGGSANLIVPLLNRMDDTLSLIALNTQKAAAGGAQLGQALAGVGAAGARVRPAAEGVAAVGDAANRAAREIEGVRERIERLAGVRPPPVGRGDDIAAYGAAMDDLRARYNPLFALQRRYRDELAEIRRAERLGALSSAETVAAIDRTKAAFAQEVLALRQVGQARRDAASAAGAAPRGMSEGALAAQRQNLTYQAYDVVGGVISGQPLPMILAQQGPQIVQAMGGIRETATALRAAVSPLTVAIAALSAGLIVGATAWGGYLASTKEVETALAGVGRGAGATAAELDAIARRGADAAGISVAAARSLEAGLLRTGRVSADVFETAIALSRDLAATIGTDVAGAGDLLAEALARPAEGARRLQEQYRLMDGSTVRIIQRLVAQNRVQEAQLVLVEALPARLADAEAATTALGRAWHTVATAAADAMDAIGGAIDRTVSGPTNDDRLASIDAELLALERMRATMSPDLYEAERQGLLEQRDVISGILGLERERAELRAREANDRAAGDVAIDIARRSPANETGETRRRLSDEIDALGAGRRSPDLTVDEQDAITRAIEAKTRALAALDQQQARNIELDRLDAEIAAARDPVTRADLVARRERLSLESQEVSSAKVAAEAERARARAIAEATTAARNRALDLADETAARAAGNRVLAGGGAQADADLAMRAQLELAPLVRAALVAEGDERERILGLIRGTVDAMTSLDQAQRQAGALAAINGRADDLQRLRTEISLVGESEAVRRRVLAVLEAEQDIRRRGIQGTPEADRLRALASAAADAQTELARISEAWSRIEDFGERTIDRLVDAIGDGDIEGAFEAILDDLQAQILELAVANPLKNALLGQNNATLTDVIGRFFGGGGAADGAAAGAGQQVASMAVTAGSVTLTGPVTGLGGLPGLGGPAQEGGAAASLSAAPNGSPPAALTGTGSALALGARFNPDIDPRLREILDEAARRFDMPVEATSGLRPGDPRFHGRGLAADVRLFGDDGRALPNYQDPTAFRDYERFAQTARTVQMEKFPELSDDFRWGGYFSGPKGKYGALDTMHFDLGGDRVGMGGGTWDGGLTPAQRQLWPGAQSMGMGALDRMGGMGAVEPGASAAAEALDRLGSTTTTAVDGLASFGDGLGTVSSDLLDSARGVGQAGLQLTTSTEAVAGQVPGVFEKLLSGLGEGVDGILGGLSDIISQIGGSGGGGFFGFVLSLFGLAEGGPVPIRVSNGEYAVPPGAAAANRPLLDAINGGWLDLGTGGRISGPGSGTSDDILATAPPGSYIVRAAAAARHGALLDSIAGSGGRVLRAFAGGGSVSPLRAFAAGGRVPPAGPMMLPSPSGGGLSVTVNNTGTPSEVRDVREEEDGRGGRRIEVTLEDAVASAITRPGSRARKAMTAGFGSRPAVVQR